MLRPSEHPGRRGLLRPLALLSAAAIAVHDLRYLLGYGGDAGHALAGQGHGYLAMLTPLVAALLTLGAARLLLRAGTTSGARPASAVRVRRLWPAAAAALVVIFTAQELLEGALASGHPPGLAGVFGDGGWIALVLAVAFGGLVAGALRVVRGLEGGGPLVRWALRFVPACPHERRTCCDRPRVLRRLVAEHLVGRGPPVVAG